jgi:hypothetical protein
LQQEDIRYKYSFFISGGCQIYTHFFITCSFIAYLPTILNELHWVMKLTFWLASAGKWKQIHEAIMSLIFLFLIVV